MPRKGVGSKVSANRTDLTLPNTTAPGQEYGERTQQQVAQGAIPMAAGERNAAPGGTPTQESAPTPIPAPGSLPFLHPSDRPNEPVTHGLPTGPGAGAEAMPAGVTNSLQQELERLAAGPFGTPQLQQLAQFARQVGA